MFILWKGKLLCFRPTECSWTTRMCSYEWTTTFCGNKAFVTRHTKIFNKLVVASTFVRSFNLIYLEILSDRSWILRTKRTELLLSASDQCGLSVLSSGTVHIQTQHGNKPYLSGLTNETNTFQRLHIFQKNLFTVSSVLSFYKICSLVRTENVFSPNIMYMLFSEM